MAVFVFRRGEFTSTPAQWAQAGPTVSGLWSAGRWESTVVSFCAEPGRESSRLGGTVGRSLPPGLAGPEAETHSHGWLCRAAGRIADRLSPGPPSALLGAQDAKYCAGRSPARSRGPHS